MAWINAVLAFLSVVVVVWGLIQRHQHRQEWHRARFPKDVDIEKSKIAYLRACEEYDRQMKQKPPFGG